MTHISPLFLLDFSLQSIALLFLGIHVIVGLIRGISKYFWIEKNDPLHYGKRDLNKFQRLLENLHINLFSFKTLYTAGYITAAIFVVILIREK